MSNDEKSFGGASPGPEQSGRDIAKPKEPSDEYNRYRLTSDLCASLVSLIVGIAWPSTSYC
jgi:hypothetical protein